jgi:hypothetical protein
VNFALPPTTTLQNSAERIATQSRDIHAPTLVFDGPDFPKKSSCFPISLQQNRDPID